MSEGRETFVAVEPEPADMLAVAVAAVASWLKRQHLEVVFRLRQRVLEDFPGPDLEERS